MGRGPTAVYLVRADGSQLKQLGLGSDPQFSSDGRYLSFLQLEEGHYALALYDLKSGQISPIELPATQAKYSWAPDASTIAVVTWGESPTRLVMIEPSTGETKQIALEDGADELAWSPDSKYLMVTSPRSTRVAISLFVAPSWQQTIVASGLVGSIGWTGDARTIAWVDGTPSTTPPPTVNATTSAPAMTRVLSYDASTRRASTLLDWHGSICDLAWLPDSTQLVFAATRDAECHHAVYAMNAPIQGPVDQQVYRINRDGSGLTQLGYVRGAAFDMELSPDGRTLGFLEAGERGIQTLHLIDLQNRIMKFSKSVGISYHLTWSPDSRWVITGGPTGLTMTNAETFQDRLLIGGGADFWTDGWAPDGKRLFIGSLCCGVQGFFYVNIDEPGKSHSVYDDLDRQQTYTASGPVWSPDGNLIAFWAHKGCAGPCG